MQLSKIDVADAQLRAAIRMFFEDAHPVAVHTLACAAHEILTNLGHKMELNTYLDQMARWQETDVATVRKEAVRFCNFMKHADNDPTALLDNFSDLDNEGVLFCACRDLAQVAHGLPIEAQVYEAWFFATAVKRVSDGGLRWREKIKACIQLFPIGMRSASREKQKQMVLQVLTEVAAKQELQMEMKRIVELPNE